MADISIQMNQGRSPYEVAIDRIWRFFCSVRAAIGEISFLALLVLIGTLRASEVPQWIADSLPFTQGFVDRWYAFDVFRSVIFAATLALIAIAIAVCTINRVPGIWQTISEPRVRTTVGYINRADTSASFSTNLSLDAAAAGFETGLRARRYRVLTEQVGNDLHVYADKNRYGKLGTFPFHLALILLMVGGIVAAQYGFREQEFIIPVGETRAVGHGTDLSVELVNFRDSYTPGAVAESYEADIIIYDGDTPVRSATISPNHPTSYGSATIYQSSLGYGATMNVTGPGGTLLYNGTVDLGVFNFQGNPDAPAGFVAIPAANAVMTIVGPDTKPLENPDLDSLNLLNGQMFVMLTDQGTNTQQVATVDQGQPMQVGDLTITFERETQWSLFQVAYNPGIPIFIIASVFLVGGLLVTFYFPLRRIRAIVSPTADQGTSIVAMPLAKRDWSGKRDFFATVRRLEETLNVAATLKRPEELHDLDELHDRRRVASDRSE
ncbi:MAG TPA: cytochrome c biogenesis protein ResB [Thermomicrobiales bacterium]|nr:cytochrome c biogenesis protein ResB [Thermomicrobiales bacterium]